MESKRIALVSSLSALSFVLLISPLFFPFPPIPFLKFDIGEAPIFLIALLSDVPTSAVAAVVVGLLVVFREGDPIGAFFKTLAIVSNAVPIAALKGRLGNKVSCGASLIIRASVMTLANYLLIPILYTPGADISQLAESLGLSLPLFLFLIFLFNLLQGAINAWLALYAYARLPEDIKAFFKAGEGFSGA